VGAGKIVHGAVARLSGR